MTLGSASKLVLVIEDEEDIRYTLQVFLESEGYVVQTAENGLSALEWLKLGRIPNCILLDMKMPVMTGWQFAREFVDRYDHLAPILIMTAAADAEQRAKEIGASGWIGKPFVLQELLDKIKRVERVEPE